MILETKRLILDKLDRDDAPFIFKLVNDPDWHQHIGDMGVKTLEDARAYIEQRLMAMYERHGHGLYRVELKDTREPIGICGLINRDGLDGIDLGFAMLRPFRRNGYTIEAASAMMTHAVTAHGYTKLLAVTKPGNEVSSVLLEKLGFQFERMVKIEEDGEDNNLYSISLTVENPDEREDR